MPHQVALDELQRRVLPSVEALKASLEARHRLSRGPTPLERLDWITSISRCGRGVWLVACGVYGLVLCSCSGVGCVTAIV